MITVVTLKADVFWPQLPCKLYKFTEFRQNFPYPSFEWNGKCREKISLAWGGRRTRRESGKILEEKRVKFPTQDYRWRILSSHSYLPWSFWFLLFLATQFPFGPLPYPTTLSHRDFSREAYCYSLKKQVAFSPKWLLISTKLQYYSKDILSKCNH